MSAIERRACESRLAQGSEGISVQTIYRVGHGFVHTRSQRSPASNGKSCYWDWDRKTSD